MSEDVKWWWMFALSAWSVVITAVVWLRKPGQDAGSAVAKLREDVMRQLGSMNDLMSAQVAELRTEYSTLEERISHMPDAERVGELAGDVKELRAEVRGLISTQTGQTMTLNRIENYLLNRI